MFAVSTEVPARADKFCHKGFDFLGCAVLHCQRPCFLMKPHLSDCTCTGASPSLNRLALRCFEPGAVRALSKAMTRAVALKRIVFFMKGICVCDGGSRSQNDCGGGCLTCGADCCHGHHRTCRRICWASLRIDSMRVSYRCSKNSPKRVLRSTGGECPSSGSRLGAVDKVIVCKVVTKRHEKSRPPYIKMSGWRR
jgi:hypothetical protein